MRLPVMVVVGLLALTLVPAAGAVRSPRIVGGVDATQPYPAQAQVNVNAGPGVRELCGGTLIDPQWVLTAGHCVSSGGLIDSVMAPSAFSVQLGSATLDAGTTYAVDSVQRAPGYDPSSFDNDAALLHLTSAAPEAPLALIDATTLADAAAGVNARVIGWGFTSENGQVSQTLRQVDVPITTDEACRGAYGTTVNLDTMVCAGPPEGGRDACQGDSGGPLMVVDGSAFILAGVVSSGDGCAQEGRYGLYTRLANTALRDWIGSVVASVQARQATATELASRPASLSGVRCTRAGCRVTATFGVGGEVVATARVTTTRRRALELRTRTLATARQAVQNRATLRLTFTPAVRRALRRSAIRRVPARLFVVTQTATGVRTSRSFAVRVPR